MEENKMDVLALVWLSSDRIIARALQILNGPGKKDYTGAVLRLETFKDLTREALRLANNRAADPGARAALFSRAADALFVEVDNDDGSAQSFSDIVLWGLLCSSVQAKVSIVHEVPLVKDLAREFGCSLSTVVHWAIGLDFPPPYLMRWRFLQHIRGRMMFHSTIEE